MNVDLSLTPLLSLVQQDDAFKLRRHIYASNRVRSENECGYLIVDAINDAIDTRHKIAFYYTDLDVAKNRHLTNGGQEYIVSPYALIWDGNFYYLHGFCDNRNALRSFRADRIEGVPTILRDLIVPKPDNYSITEYSKSIFRVYDTDKPVMVKHSEGQSEEALRAVRAELFKFQNSIHNKEIDRLRLYHSTLSEVTLNITEQDLNDYADALIDFWRSIPVDQYMTIIS